MTEESATTAVIQQENLDFILNTDQYYLSIIELVSYLSDTDRLIRSINKTLNVKYGIGYDDIEIQVLAFEKGSFKIPLQINKFIKNPILKDICKGVCTGVFVQLIIGLFLNDSNPQLIQCGQDVVPVKTEELLENKRTASLVGDIAKAIVGNESIKGLSIEYKNEKGDLERVSINKQTLSKVMYDVDDEDIVSNMLENVRLEVVSPVFLEEPSKWRVRLNGHIYNAKMTDDEFLTEVNAKRMSFAPGDIVVADLETQVKETRNGGTRTSYFIRKVRHYPHYSRILKDKELFNN